MCDPSTYKKNVKAAVEIGSNHDGYHWNRTIVKAVKCSGILGF